MASYTKQHFVPQNSLRRFTHDDEHLFVFDKFKQEVRPSNVRDIAEERHFNRIPVDELPSEVASKIIDPDGIERALEQSNRITMTWLERSYKLLNLELVFVVF